VALIMRIDYMSTAAVQHEQESDDELLSDAKSGGQRAFDELCMRYRGRVSTWMMKIGVNTALMLLRK
jgi:hypothetical protein